MDLHCLLSIYAEGILWFVVLGIGVPPVKHLPYMGGHAGQILLRPVLDSVRQPACFTRLDWRPEVKEIRVMDGCMIPCSKGLFVIVDIDDYQELSKYKWSVTSVGNKLYAHRRLANSEPGKMRRVKMHRVIMGLDEYDGRTCVDHINGDTLDNRKANLRICTAGENSKNLSKTWGASQMRGVQKVKNGKWRVRIRVDYKMIAVGTFDTERDASIAYCFASRILHGEYGSTPGHDSV